MIPTGRETIWLLVGVAVGMWIVPRVMMAVQSRTSAGG